MDFDKSKLTPGSALSEFVDVVDGEINSINEQLYVADPNGYEYVDLGLPSGILWAKCNVGASTPEGYGKYFAWGEVIGYDDAKGVKKFTWSDYQLGNGGSTESDMAKYNATDRKTVLELEDDAAHVNMGGSWRMPTEAEFKELTANTTVTWETVNGVNGRKFTNKSDSSKYIFIPAAGYCYSGSRSLVGSYGYVWSSSLGSSYRNYAWCLYFNSDYMSMGSSYRCFGQSVRGVLVENKPAIPTKADKVKGASEGDIAVLDATGNLTTSNLKVNDIVPSYSSTPQLLISTFNSFPCYEVVSTVTANALTDVPSGATYILSAVGFNTSGSYPLQVTKGVAGWEVAQPTGISFDYSIVRYCVDYIDLGLPSGLKWASCNVGASKPEEYGLYFAWGETTGYADASSGKAFSWSDYKYGNGGSSASSMTKYNATDGKTTLELTDDAAYVASSGKFRMPSQSEFNELTTYTTVTWETVNGVNGRKFTNKSDSSKYIFIPAAGYCSSGSRYSVGSSGYVWSSSLYSSYRLSAWYLYFGSDSMYMSYDNRCYGLGVRGVLVGNKQ